MTRKNILVPLLIAVGAMLLLQLAPRPAQAAGNGISSPADGATVSGIVTIRGTADDPNFLKYQLDVLIGGDEQQVVPVTVGRRAVPFDDVLGHLDTRTLPDGAYRLRLRVVRQDANYSEYSIAFTVNNSSGPTPTNAPGASRAKPVAPALNSIANPANGATVTGTVSVEGAADDPSFDSWHLDILYNGDPLQALPIGMSNTPNSTVGLLTQLDTTLLPNGKHVLRLRVERKDGTFSETESSFTVSNSHPPAAAQPVRVVLPTSCSSLWLAAPSLLERTMWRTALTLFLPGLRPVCGI